jgi:hypothetical protein
MRHNGNTIRTTCWSGGTVACNVGRRTCSGTGVGEELGLVANGKWPSSNTPSREM